MTEYTPPDRTDVAFELEAYDPPDSDSVQIVLGETVLTGETTVTVEATATSSITTNPQTDVQITSTAEFSLYRSHTGTTSVGIEADARTDKPVWTITDLPGIEDLTLDNGIVDEIEASWENTINNGQYEVEYYDDEHGEEFTPHAILEQDEHATVIDGLLDGQQYNVRVRTSTDYRTTEWAEDDVVTKFPAVTDLEVVEVTETTVALEWTDNSDNEAGQRILRERYRNGNWWPIEVVDEVGDSVESFTDETAQPGIEYRYRIGTWTTYTSTESEPVTTETVGIGLETTAMPSSGPYVEIDHPDAIRPLTPDPQDIQRNPTVNGFPTVEIPVRYDDRWHSDALDDAPMQVWHDADKQPIDTLEHRRLEEGDGTKQTVLEGRGGTQLDRRVIEDVSLQETHEFIAYLLEEYTDYSYDIDDPAEDIDEGVVLQAAETLFELQQAFEEIPDDVPLEWDEDNDQLKPLQTAYVAEAEAHSGDTQTDDDYSGGEAAQINDQASDDIDPSFDVEYELVDPALVIRSERPGGTVDVRIEVDGTEISSNDPLSGALSWNEREIDFDVGPGEIDVSIEHDDLDDADGQYIDVVALVDREYVPDPDTWDYQVHGPGGYLDDPTLYPEAARLETVPITTPLVIQALEIAVTTDDANPIAELSLGVDGTDDWDTVEDALEHDIEYTEPSTEARARIGLGYNDETRDDQTPRTGFEPQGLDSLELTADLDDTPVLTDRSFDDRLVDVLREVSEIGNFVFGVDAEGDDTIVRVTRLEGRPEDVDPDIAEYSIDKQTEDVLERAVVYGGAQRVTRQFVDVEHDEWVDLPVEGKIVEGQVEITDEDNDDSYDRGDDYELRHTTEDGTPQIRALADGDIADGETVRFGGDVKPRGEFTDPDVDEEYPKTEIEDIPGLASAQMCEQVALYLVEETGHSIVEAEITVPHDSVEWSIIGAIDPAQLPGEGPYQVRDVSSDSSQTVVQLGQGQTIDEAVSEIRDRTSRTEERV